ncbi:MAG: outer membrane protein [Labilithrix sp.]|nr:outer membrane protein [Labilithrix sp.]
MHHASRHARRALARIAVPALAALLTFAGAPRQACAQALLERFDPAERGSRFFVADSLELDGDQRLTTGAVFSYAHGLRTFRQSGSDPVASELVSDALWIHPGASLVLAPGARLALDLPLVLQSGRDVSLDRKDYRAPGSPRLGDLRASFDLRVLGESRPDVDGAVLAVGVSAYLPTGSGADYAGDDAIRFAVRVSGAARLGAITIASRAGYMYRREDVAAIAGVDVHGELNASLAAGYQVLRDVTVGPELSGSTTFGSVLEKQHTPIEGLLGSHVTRGHFTFGAGIGTRLVGGLGSPDVRGVLSVEWSTAAAGAPVDRDGDGIVDRDDACPDLPGDDAPGPGRGCPPPPALAPVTE